MNRKEIREIRTRFNPDEGNLSKIYGCYVNAGKEIVTELELSTMMMEKEEKEQYMALLKKTLSGSLGRNLFNLEFATESVGNSDEHKLLMALNESHLKDENMRQLFYQRVIETFKLEETSYVILLVSDIYDIPYKQGRSEEWDEDSTEQFDYFLCTICPVRDSKGALKYLADEGNFRATSTGSVLAPPVAGFMFPAFDDRAKNIYNLLYYTKSKAEIHEELMNGLLGIENSPMAAECQMNAFGTALSDALGKECSLDVVRTMTSQLMERIEHHKESKEPTEPEIMLDEVDRILMSGGVSDDGIIEFNETVNRSFNGATSFNPENLVNNKAFALETAEAKITVDPEHIYQVRTEVIDGRNYILIPVGEGVTVNGIDVSVGGNGDE